MEHHSSSKHRQTIEQFRRIAEQGSAIMRSVAAHGSRASREFLALRNEKPRRFCAIAASVTVLCIIAISGTITAIARMGGASDDALPQTLVTTGGDARDAMRTIHPELVRDSSTALIPGIVLSNETANIFPRRDGIVEDVYVDIGDRVEKNQIVALLLSKGVEGQSAAAIAQKRAMKAQSEADYLNTQSVALQAVGTAEEQLRQKQTALAVARNEQEGLLQKIEQAQTNVSQMQEQAFLAARDARQIIERILTGTNAQTGIEIRENDIIREFGIIRPQTRYDIVPIFNDMKRLENSYKNAGKESQRDITSKMLSTVDDGFTALHELLAASPAEIDNQPNGNMKKNAIEMTKETHAAQDRVLKAKEKWEDAVLSARELEQNEPDLVALLRKKTQNAESNKVKLLTSEITTMQQTIRLIESQQKQQIERAEKGVDVAEALLSSEVAQSGHREIRSPFAGVVSRRFIEVGQIVMPSSPSFELVNVPTSLSKKAKAEIQFGMPENMEGAVQVGDIVTFFLPNNERNGHEAVVTRKSPQVDGDSHSITVQAKIDDSLSLPHRTSVRVRITDQSTPIFRVPSFAVKRTQDGWNFMWILKDDSKNPTQIPVTVNAEDGEFAEVSGDIDKETTIVLDSPDLFMIEEEEEDFIEIPAATP